MTTVKIFNNEKIHKLSQLPQSLSSLHDSIKLVLQDSLPSSYVLQYEDLEGDHVMLASEEDYKAMLLSELPKDQTKSLRIRIVAREKPSFESSHFSSVQKLEHADNKDIHEQILEGNSTIDMENLIAKPELRSRNEEDLDSSDEEEKEGKSRDDFEPFGREKRHRYGESEKDEMKRQKKMMKKEIKVHRQVRKTEMLKEAITEALFDNLPTIAKVVRAYVQDPTMNLEETVQSVRPKTSLGAQLEDQESLQANFKRPFLMFRSLIDVYRGLTDEQKTETNKLLGGIPEKLLAGDHDKHDKYDKYDKHEKDKYKENKYKKSEWNSETSKSEEQEGKWRHRHHRGGFGGGFGGRGGYGGHGHGPHGHGPHGGHPGHPGHPGGYGGYGGYDKRDKEDKNSDYGGQEGWRKKGKGREGNEEKKNYKKETREGKEVKGKDEESAGSEFSMELVKEVGSIPPKVSVTDGTIYKTVTIKNTGEVEWPRSALLIPRGEIRGEIVRLTNVKPGQEYSPVLVLKGPGKAGNFVTAWKLAYKDEQGKNYFTGASIKVGLTVFEES